MNELLDRVQADLDRFEHALLKRGFRRVPTESGQAAFEGAVALDEPETSQAIRVELPVGWPFVPTIVQPLNLQDAPSWHRARDGALCLFSRNEGGLPWADVDSLLAQTRRWFDEERRGWTPGLVDMDLERYFSQQAGLVLYHDLDSLAGRFVKTRKGPNGTIEITPTGRSAARKYSDAWVGDLGALDRPVRNWDEVAARLDLPDTVARWIRTNARGSLLLLRYTVAGVPSVIALRAQIDDDRIALESIESASMAPAIMTLRGGRHRDLLGERSVAIIGAGAVGSHLASMLARCGIGRLELHDRERLRPGNCIRHLAGPEDIGKTKVHSVRDVLRRHEVKPRDGVDAYPAAVLTVAHLDTISTRVDLVVDCTGSPTSADLLARYAESSGRAALAAYLQRGGEVVRIERYPFNADPADLFVVPPAHGSAPGQLLFEQGCGEPVSPSTPSQVLVAASLAAEAVIAVLRDAWPHDVVTLVIQPQGDPPLETRAWID